MTEAVAVKVRVGTITSSPGPIPHASAARCSPAVAEFTATASTPSPMNAANFCSNSRAVGPVVSHPDRNTAVTAAISSSPMAGRKHGMPAGAARTLCADDLVGTHEREDLRNAAFKGPGRFEPEPGPDLFERDAVVAFVDERLIGRDLGVGHLPLDELGDDAQSEV